MRVLAAEGGYQELRLDISGAAVALVLVVLVAATIAWIVVWMSRKDRRPDGDE